MNDFDKLINERMYFMDFEVTKFDWLLIIHKYSDNSETVLHNSTVDEIYDFMKSNNPIFLAHNGRYYDQYILKAILSGFDIHEIKSVNDHIINGGQGFEIQYEYLDVPIIMWDTMQDIVPPKSLKEIEANLCMDITESTIDFNINHEWNEHEYNEMLYYCRHDVDALRPLFEARKSYFKTKYDLCILSNIDPAINVGLTNAKLCAKFLEASLVKREDEREYTIPSTIDLKYVPNEILKFFNRIHDKSITDEQFFTTKLEFNFHGMPSVFALGGAHGALPNFIYDEKETPDIVVINVDYSSLYPHLLALLEYNYISRNIKDKNKYYDTLQRRLKLKHEGKKEEQLPLKLILNTTYGCQNNKYNDLYDPRGARSTCITGQLMIASMTEEVYQIGDVKLIQINTDGLMVALPKSKLSQYYDVCNRFSERVKIGVEYDIIHKIVQRDVNNYIMIYGEKEHLNIKAKGGCFGALPNLKIEEDGTVTSKYVPNFKANSLAIVSEALAKNLLFDTPIEYTILNETITQKFQIVSHLGSTYEKCVQESPDGDILLQRNNRIYAGKKPSGKIIKVKYDGRRDSLANQPTNPVIDNKNVISIEDIDKAWYIKLANQWANDFKGVKRLTEYKKDELLELALKKGLSVDKKIKKADLIKLIEESEENNMSVKELEKDKDVSSMNIYQKIAEMTKEIRQHDFVLDCVNPSNLGGKEYASIAQYYNVLHNLCEKYELLFKWEVTDLDYFEKDVFKPIGKMPSNVAIVKCLATFINIDGSSISYFTIAGGSDLCDKAPSGASTLAFRNWFDKNFTPNYLNQVGDEEISSEEVKTEEPKIPTYIPPEKKEQLVEKVVNEKQIDNNEEYKQSIIAKIMDVRSKLGNDSWGENTVNSILTEELSSADLLSIELKVNNKLDSLN